MNHNYRHAAELQQFRAIADIAFMQASSQEA
jgi:hypothetical protein